MISASLASKAGIKVAASAPTTSSLRARAAALGISASNTGVVKQELVEPTRLPGAARNGSPRDPRKLSTSYPELPDYPVFSSTADDPELQPTQPTEAFESKDSDVEPGFWEEMPDPVEDPDDDRFGSKEAAAPPVPPPPGSRLLLMGTQHHSPSAGPSLLGGARVVRPPPVLRQGPPQPSSVLAGPRPPPLPPPVAAFGAPRRYLHVKEELLPRGAVLVTRPHAVSGIRSSCVAPRKAWEVEKEKKRKEATLRDLTCKAICVVKHGLRQEGAQADGKALVPSDWDTSFKPQLGSYIKFLLSRPDQFKVIEGSGPGIFTVENIATTETVEAPAWGVWRKGAGGKGKADKETKEEIKEEPANAKGKGKSGRKGKEKPQQYNVCWQFMKGYCRDGQQCRWVHPNEEEEESSTPCPVRKPTPPQLPPPRLVPAAVPSRPLVQPWLRNISQPLPALRPIRSTQNASTGQDAEPDLRQMLPGTEFEENTTDAAKDEEEWANVEALPFEVDGEDGAVSVDPYADPGDTGSIWSLILQGQKRPAEADAELKGSKRSREAV